MPATDAHRNAEFAHTIQFAREAITTIRLALLQAAEHFDDDRVDAMSPSEALLTGMALGSAAQEALRPAAGVVAGMGFLAAPDWREHMHDLMAQMKRRDGSPAEVIAHYARVLGDVGVGLAALDTELRQAAIQAFDERAEAAFSDADLQALLPQD